MANETQPLIMVKMMDKVKQFSYYILVYTVYNGGIQFI